jgi:C-terminal processing protease CtpA/Prc
MLADKTIMVRQIVAGGPAHLAGIMVGDIITHIDGKTTAGADFDTVVQKYLRGRAGSKVTLKIRRKGDNKTYSLVLTRRQLVKKDEKRGNK